MLKIGAGRTAEVFDLGDGRVLKLFNAGYPVKDIGWEAHNAELVNALPVPMPHCYGLMETDGRTGIVYDRVKGEDMLIKLFQTRDFEKYTHLLAQVHQKLLACTLPEAVDAKDFLRGCLQRAKRSEEQLADLYAALDALPDGDTLCHGDFHYGNVMLDGDQCTVIDMMNICRGDAHYDIARTYFLIALGDLPPETPASFVEMRLRVGEQYLREMGVCREEIEGWLKIICVARETE